MTNGPAPAPSRRSLRGALAGGLVAGAADIGYACAATALAGRSPVRTLQSVASGALGAAAFQGGMPTALLGLLCHFAITIVAALVYGFAYARMPLLRTHFVVGAIAFGTGVYLVMHGIVLPLSAIPFKMTYPLANIAQGLAVHILLVGIPIALCVRFLGYPKAER